MELILFTILLSLSFFLILVLPGFLLLGLLQVKLKFFEKLAVSVITSAAISSLIIFITTMAFGWSPTVLWLTILIENLILFWTHRLVIGSFLTWDKSDDVTPNGPYRRTIWIIALALGLLFIIASWEFKDNLGIWHTTVIGDNDKHMAMVLSLMNSQKFPASIITSHLQPPVQVSYYYFFYLLVAAIGTLTQRIVPATYLLSFVGGLILSAGLILLSLTGSSVFKNKKVAFLASFLPLLAGFQIIALVKLYFQGNLMHFLSMYDDMFNMPVFSLAHAIGWVPQHLLGLFFVLLFIFLLGQAKRKNLLMIVLGALTASLAATSFFIFVALAISGMIYLIYLLVSRGLWRILLPTCLFLISFGIFFIFTSQAVLNSAPKEFIGNTITLLIRNPILDNTIFSYQVGDVGFWGRIWWTSLYFLERLGMILPLGLVALYYFRQLIWQKKDLALLVILGFSTLITNFLLFLPGEQNEFAKYSSLLYLIMFGFLTAGLIERWISQYRDWLQNQTKPQANLFWSYLKNLLIKLGWTLLIIGFLFNLGSAWWSYHWSILYIKLKSSADIHRNDSAQAAGWLRKNTSVDAIIASHPLFETLLYPYGERTVLADRKLGAFPVSRPKQYNERDEIVSSLERIDANGLNKSARNFLVGHDVDYYVTVKDDAIFEKRKQVVDQQYFSEVYSNTTSAIYKVK